MMQEVRALNQAWRLFQSDSQHETALAVLVALAALWPLIREYRKKV
jgi:hypothetical protein